MQRIGGRFVFSASDLNNFLECRRLTELERLVALGEKTRPPQDESTLLVARKGEEHERRYLEQLAGKYSDIVIFHDPPENTTAGLLAAEAATVAAMERGAYLIYQATFFDGEFLGRADFLRRVDVPSTLGRWSYEVIDTKLAVNPKPYFVIQLCDYSAHLERIQGTAPQYGYIVLGTGDEQRFRIADYAAYYRNLKARFLASAANELHTYPLKCSHCKICAWAPECAQKRLTDDHLSLVAWMRRDQAERFESAGITTLAALAQAGDASRPPGMNQEMFAKLRRQATMQLRGRNEGRAIYEVLEHHPALGFGLLPQPSDGDVFFDMEGDPLYEPGRSLEYLFGVWLPGERETYRAFWGLDRSREKLAFENFIDFVCERRARYPKLHVYHYASYEKSALRRLAQEHCTREEELDELLRGEVFVDLFTVVRQSLVLSEDSYGLKRLERFYGLERATDVKKGDDSILMFERWRDESSQQILNDIEQYNRDDCRSMELLLKWLLERRDEAIAQRGMDIPFYVKRDDRCHDEPAVGCRECKNRMEDEREYARTTNLERILLQDVLPPLTETEYKLMSDDRLGRYLLANLLAYHRREEKPGWWQYYDRCENIDELLEFDKDAIAGLQFVADTEPIREKKSFLYTYTFPEQHYKLEAGDQVHDPAIRDSVGTIFDVDADNNRLRLKSTLSAAQASEIRALIPAGPINSKPQQASLAFIAQSYLDSVLSRDYPATLALLLRRPPRPAATGDVQPQEIDAHSVSAIVQALDGDCLFIQGPPGSGKSTIASKIICDLLHGGKRIGVMSNSHKAVHNLLHMVEHAVLARGGSFAGLYKHSESNTGSRYASELTTPFIQSSKVNADLDAGQYDLAGGTAWLFSRESLRGTFDYLFIDEAGQTSLADAMSVAPCAKNVVLLGDPVQLAQVSQGRHPLHTGDSVLKHLLEDSQTIAKNKGVFLDRSWRMHPQICAFISDMMYDGRLRAAQDTERHRVSSAGLTGAGLRFIALDHHGNGRSSTEEADRIVAEILLLLRGSVMESKGPERPLMPNDVIVVTPYNAQRLLIRRKLLDAGIDVRVGTVDKFQGQQAAVVFYSLASSSGDDIPRHLEFAFEPNRFNVAISRAKCLTAIVCSPRLLEAPVRNPQQIALVNLLCAYREASETAQPAEALV